MKAKFGHNATHQITMFTPLSRSTAFCVCTKKVYNQTIYTAVKQCSFTCMHKDGLQPNHLHCCQTVQLYMSAQRWFTTKPFTPLSNGAALHVCTMMVYNHTIYTTVTQYSFLCTHNDGLQPHHLHHCQTVQLYM